MEIQRSLAWQVKGCTGGLWWIKHIYAIHLRVAILVCHIGRNKSKCLPFPKAPWLSRPDFPNLHYLHYFFQTSQRPCWANQQNPWPKVWVFESGGAANAPKLFENKNWVLAVFVNTVTCFLVINMLIFRFFFEV